MKAEWGLLRKGRGSAGGGYEDGSGAGRGQREKGWGR